MTMALSIGKYSMIPLYVLCIALCYPVSGENIQGIQNLTAQGKFDKEAVLTCMVFPANLTVEWLFKGKNLAEDPQRWKRSTLTNTTKENFKDDPDGTKLKATNYILKIANPTEQDAGNYTCVTQHGMKSTTLNVSFPGKLVGEPPARLNFTSTMSEEDRMLNLKCVFEVYNQTKVEWILQRTGLDNLVLEGNTTKNETNKKQLIGTYSTRMSINNFDEQNGTYICLVFDSHGHTNLTGRTDVFLYAPPVLEIVFAIPISSSEIYFNWTVKAYNSPIRGYDLAILDSPARGFVSYPKRIEGNKKYFIIPNLKNNTAYKIKLEVETHKKSNPAMLPVSTEYPNGTVRTLAEDPVFVPNISINGFTARSMTIGLSAPPAEVVDYVQYYELEEWKKGFQENTTQKACHVRDYKNLPYMFNNLDPHSTYVFRARACFEFGIKSCGDWSEEMEAVTMDGIPNEPSDVRIYCNTSLEQGHYINLTWNPPDKPNAEIKGYMMEVTGNSSYIDRFGMWKVETFGPLSKFMTNQTLTVRVPDLKPNTNYTVRLMAMTRSRRRGQEKVVNCSTGYGPPDNPPRPRWRKVEEKLGDDSKYSLRVLVPRSSERNGPICCYRVHLVRLPAGHSWTSKPPEDLPLVTYYDAHAPAPDHDVAAYVTDVFNHQKFPTEELILGDLNSLTLERTGDNATCSRCFQRRARDPPPAPAPAPATTEDPDYEDPVTSGPNTRRSLVDSELQPYDGKLDPLANYTLFVELIPGTAEDEPLFSSYTVALNTAIPSAVIAANTMEMALQICCAIAALLLLATLIFCVVHTRRARKQPPRQHVELNPIQAALRYVVGHIGGRQPLVSAPPPDLPPIALEDLAAAYAERQADSDYGFQKEFELLQMLPECYPDRTTHASEARENQPKNRYPDIKAYDQTRVKLSQIDGISGSDYINANYVMGYKLKESDINKLDTDGYSNSVTTGNGEYNHREHKQFICAQGPTDTTVNDFWRMIWEHGLELIVMLTNLEEYSKVKCSKYWPDEVRGTRAFGNITVHHVSEKRYSDYIVRELKIVKQPTNSEGQPIVENNGVAKRNGDCKDVESGSAPTSPRETKESSSRIVKQYHFLMWKDFAAPEHPQSILKFIKRVNEAWSALMGRAVVVHCSAGVGRTGTLVALDCLLQQLGAARRAAVFGTVAELRRQRNFLVQSLKQYVFVYRALVEFAHYGDTEIPASRLKASVDRLRNTPEGADKCLMELEFEKMMNPPIPEPLKSCSAGAAEEARAKNRSADWLPYDRNRVILAPAPPHHHSTYINASFIEAYDNSEGYIITQDPLPNTIIDFWRMVSEHNVSTIVMLSELGDGKCPRYWDDGTAQYEHISVQYEESESCPYYTRRQFRVTNNKSGDATSVRQLQYHGWPTAPGHVPEVTRGLAELADAARPARAPHTPQPAMLIHCQYGTERSALFAALCVLITQLRTERRVDVAAAARKVRSQRAGTIDTFLQYEFLHRAILNYAELHNLLEDS